jgi:TATA-binding protein-associated factor Taf7
LGFASAGEVEDDEEDEDKDEDEDEDEEREEEERVEVEDEEGAAAVEEPCASRRRLDGRSDAIQMFGWASGLKVILLDDQQSASKASKLDGPNS